MIKLDHKKLACCFALAASVSACHDGIAAEPDAGQAAEARVVFPSTIALGDVACGGSKNVALRLENPGQREAQFSLEPRTPQIDVAPRQGSIVAGAQALISATLRIPVEANPGASLQDVISATSLERQQDIVLTATVVGARFALSATSHQFGAVAVGESVSATVTATNTGNRPGQVRVFATDAALTGQVVGDPFADVLPGESVDIVLRFSPVVPGQVSGQVSFVPHANTCGPEASLEALGSGT